MENRGKNVICDPFFSDEGVAVIYSNPTAEWSHICVMEFLKFLYARYNLIYCSPNCITCFKVYEAFSKGTVGALKDASLSCSTFICRHSLERRWKNLLSSILIGIRVQVLYIDSNDESEEAYHFKINYDISDVLSLKVEDNKHLTMYGPNGLYIGSTNTITICQFTGMTYMKERTTNISSMPDCEQKKIRVFLCTGDYHSGTEYTNKALQEQYNESPLVFYTAIPRNVVINMYFKGFMFVPYSATAVVMCSVLGRDETFSFINGINPSFLDMVLTDLVLIDKTYDEKKKLIFSEAVSKTISFIHYLHAGKVERTTFLKLVQSGLNSLKPYSLYNILHESNRNRTNVSDLFLHACVHVLHYLSCILEENHYHSDGSKPFSFCARPMRRKFYEFICSERELRKKKKRDHFMIIVEDPRASKASFFGEKSNLKSCTACTTIFYQKEIKAISFMKTAVKRLVLIAATSVTPLQLAPDQTCQLYVDTDRRASSDLRNVLRAIYTINKLGTDLPSFSNFNVTDLDIKRTDQELKLCSDMYSQRKVVSKTDDRGLQYSFYFDINAYNTNRVIFIFENETNSTSSVDFQNGKDLFVRKSYKIGKKATISVYHQSDKKVPVMINCRQTKISELLLDKRMLTYYDNRGLFKIASQVSPNHVFVVNSNFCANLHGIENIYCIANEFLSKGNCLKSRKFPSVTKQLLIEESDQVDNLHSLKSYLSLNVEKGKYCYNSTVFRSGVCLIIVPDRYIDEVLRSQISSLDEICQINPFVQQICVFNEKVNQEGLSHMNSRFIGTLGETLSCLGNYGNKIKTFCQMKSMNLFTFSESVISNARRHCTNPCIGRLLHQSNDKIHMAHVHNDLPNLKYIGNIKEMERVGKGEHAFIKKLKKKHNILSSKSTITNRSKYSNFIMNSGMNYIDCHYGLIHRNQAKVCHAVYLKRIRDIMDCRFPFQHDNLMALQLPSLQFLRQKWHLVFKKKIY